MRRSTLLWSVLSIAVVIGLFVIKHRVQDLENQLNALNAEILANRDATQVLEAEWSYLNQPARLDALSRKLLGMKSPTADQTITMEEFRLQMTLTSEDDTADTILVQPADTQIKSAQKLGQRVANQNHHKDYRAKPEINWSKKVE